MNFARTALTAVALMGAASTASAATSIVTNGSFETGSLTGAQQKVNAGQTNITGWTVGGNSVDYVRSYWMASDGRRSIDLAGSSPGTLSQLLATTAGVIYKVQFDISKNPDNGQVPRFGTSSVTDVSGAPLVLESVGLSFSSANTRADMMWETVSYSFLAMSASTLLSFAADSASSSNGAGSRSFGLALDNVSVAAVPEPAAWALMILGFGIVGSALRRRRTQVRFNFA